MIAYTTLGSNDLPRAIAFYDALLADLGLKRLYADDHFVAWGTTPEAQKFCLVRPFDGEASTAGNGVMIALSAKDPAHVDALHARALELGATDEGAPGPRGDRGFYVGYFRDLDRNKLNVSCR